VRYLLDTCLFSELFKPLQDGAVVSWIERQHVTDLFMSVVTVGEIQKGISKVSPSDKATRLDSQFSIFLSAFEEEQVLPLDQDVLRRWGILCARSERHKVTLPVLDSLIAATALEKGLVVATRNVKDFERCGVQVVNPWEG
jgi:predicted nucleic acid-binding protein